MAGRTKQLIDELVVLRTGGSESLGHFVRAHLMMRGINPDVHSAASADDPKTVQVLEQMIADFRAQRSGQS